MRRRGGAGYWAGSNIGRPYIRCMGSIQSRMGVRVGDVDSLQRRRFGLLAVTQGNRGMRRDGVGTDNFLEEVGNLS